MHIGHVHGDVEKMPGRICQRQLIRNRRIAWQYNNDDEREIQENKSAQVSQTKTKVFHLELASAVAGCGAPSFFRSFSQRPSKLPFDMISTKTLGLAFTATNSATAFPPDTTPSSLPHAPT